MDLEQIETTDIWQLYQKSENFMSRRGIYNDTDLNYRMYNGDQWYGANLKGIDKIQYNIIKPIIKYKVTTITSNLFAVNYSPENLISTEFIEEARKTCELLNKKANQVFDKDQMDSKIKKWCRQSAINDESICYITYDDENNIPINEIISKNDIMYGNENNDNIQDQPYILIRQRKSIKDLREEAEILGLSEDDIDMIIGDNDTSNASGLSAKDEIDDNAWIITKMYKKEGTVFYSKATKYVTFIDDEDSQLSVYPVAHFNWEDNEGNARGIGETRQLIPNQLEINKTAMRRALVVKTTAYPHRVVNTSMVTNIADVNKVGSLIKFDDMGQTKASDVFQSVTPSQMSTDSEKLQTELITYTRELNNAGDAATGSIDPSQASGTAILAVQSAQNAPLNDQLISLKTFLEDLARIWFEMWKLYPTEPMVIEYEESDPTTGDEIIYQVEIPEIILEKLQTIVKVDITPKSAFDKYAQELSLENMLNAGHITFEEYVSVLEADSTMPKVKLDSIVSARKEAQAKIAAMQQQATKKEMEANKNLATSMDLDSMKQQGQNMIAQSQSNAMQNATSQASADSQTKNSVESALA